MNSRHGKHEKITAEKQTRKVDGTGYVSHFKAFFCVRIVVAL